MPGGDLLEWFEKYYYGRLPNGSVLRRARAARYGLPRKQGSVSAVMRRALEYATTFDLPVIQHAEDHALTEGAQMHEGSVSTRLGLRGWQRNAEDVIVARRAPEGLSARNLFEVRIRAIARAGADVTLRCSPATSEPTPEWIVRVTPSAAASLGLSVGQTVFLAVKSHSFRLL